MIIIALVSPTAMLLKPPIKETILTNIPTVVMPDSSSESSPLQQMLCPERGLSLHPVFKDCKAEGQSHNS